LVVSCWWSVVGGQGGEEYFLLFFPGFLLPVF
jgi:hypothetical protein